MNGELLGGSCRSGDEAFGLLRELAGTGEGAEEVGGALVHEPAGRADWVDSHPTDRVDGESALRRLALADGREDLNRFAHVS
jgi:hypothetical protein